MRENMAPTKRALSGPSPRRTGLALPPAVIPGSPMAGSSCWLDVASRKDRGEQDHRDVAIDVEEGHVQSREIHGRHERVLVDEEGGDEEHADPVEDPEPHHPA